jgi:uncharacterized membrane protein
MIERDANQFGRPDPAAPLTHMKLLSNQDPASPKTANRLALGLGWFSIGLGLAQLIAPRAVSRLLGVPHRPVIFALLGVRELASGIGILQKRQPADWLWARVAGDVMDLSLLGAALASDESEALKVEAAAAAVLAVTALDIFSARQQSALDPQHGCIHFQKCITINRDPAVVYNFWRNFENLPRFMHNLESVTTQGLTRSHWVAKGPAGQKVEWDAELLEDIPGHLISWRSVEGSDVDNAGAVRFEEAPGKRGTIVRVDMTYRVPAGKLGAVVAKVLGKAPDQEVQGDLYRFKQVLESGHIATTEGQSSGRASNSSLF